MRGFAELVATTNYSFLRGASHPSDMVGEAMALGLSAIGIADRNIVAGVVRAYVALRDAPEKARANLMEEKAARGEKLALSEAEEAQCLTDLRLLVGSRLVFADGTPDIVAYPATRHGWGRLTRLLTCGNLKAVKGDCILTFADLIEYLDDLLLIVLPTATAEVQTAHKKPVDYAFADDAGPLLRLVAPDAPIGLDEVLARLVTAAPGRVWLGAAMGYRGDDARRLAGLAVAAQAAGVPLLATNDALYAGPEQRPLHDVLTCIRRGCTIATAGRTLEANAERHLKSEAQMRRLFRDHEQAVDETLRFIARVRFTLDDLRYEYPHEPVPEGRKPMTWLHHLVKQAAHDRYGAVLPPKVRALLAEEFRLIRKRGYAYYFLTVHDLVRFARTREPPILCQGRGSAANSIVCFLLGVTSVDPLEHDLLFSRFVSEDRNEPPDIDVDFEHERREEVMQYIYERYGRHRAGIAATVIHYRPRSAVGEVGKVLGFTDDMTARLAGTIWGSFAGKMEERRYAEAGVDPNNPAIVQLKGLVDQLLDFPRHLSQHVGGFVLTEDRLDETVPIHHAAMADRSFIEWDKDDIDALGLMKVDVLALGMLTCIRKGFALLREHGLGHYGLDVDLAAEDPAVYDMLCKGDSIGVFQVESRAQINMLPRLKPRTLYDLTIQVAIVRPGPIEGDMVHPYLRRRSGMEAIEYPKPAPPHDPNELRDLLGKTEGVPLFQEQAMKLAIVAAGFTPSEANQLRRAMATFRNVGTIQNFRSKMVEGMDARGYDRDFAERCFKQIEGFGSYGFPESHALSFARLVYVSSWIKCHHPAIFACALLNAQPMGFYAPAQLVRDAREHGVEVRPIDVNTSGWDNGLERRADGHLALRLGLRQLDGFRAEWADRLVTERVVLPFVDIETLAHRTMLPSRALRLLADADAFGALTRDRRDALWDVRRTPSRQLPLFAAAQASELGAEPSMDLPAMAQDEHVMLDYQTTRLSLKGHPMAFLRGRFRAGGVLSCEEIGRTRNGAQARAAGLVLVRQRPGKGNAIFVTLEDETGIVNIVIWARLFETMRRAVMTARLMMVEGTVQKSPEGVVHLMASRVHDRTAWLDLLSEGEGAAPSPPDRARHPRNARIMPKSRDFH
ncbi:MAG: error-prone DNA polymerase [Sphingomonadaceae bacterium]|nr:error-prone DNA polymerase [Sphingomonadaceae bacterium]